MKSLIRDVELCGTNRVHRYGLVIVLLQFARKPEVADMITSRKFVRLRDILFDKTNEIALKANNLKCRLATSGEEYKLLTEIINESHRTNHVYMKLNI